MARNTLLNFFGQAVPLVIGVITIPFIVRGLGTERFGLLSLAWVVLGYSSVFDLGLGRATTKFVAESLAKGERNKIPYVVWTAVTGQALLGLLVGIGLIAITPLLVKRVLNIPPNLIKEAKVTFYFLSLSVPIVMISRSFRGVLEASQRFDLVNAVRIPVSSCAFLLPLIGVLLGIGLTEIVALIMLVNFGALVAFMLLNFHLAPELKRYSLSFALFPRLFSFGGWITVTNVVSPILVYLDRFLIGSLLSIAAVAYYSAPYEAMTRLTIIAGSLAMTLFPAFSSLDGVKDNRRFMILFVHSIKCIFLALVPIVVGIWLFAREILLLWLGPDFAVESTGVLQILALGVLVNSLARIPIALLQGGGRPDLPAKFHLFELPLYIGTLWLFVNKWGVIGAATSWTLRVTLDAFLLFAGAFITYRFPWRLYATRGLRAAAFVALLTSMACALKILTKGIPLFVQIALFIILLGIFFWFTWRKMLDESDRNAIQRAVRTWYVTGRKL